MPTNLVEPNATAPAPSPEVAPAASVPATDSAASDQMRGNAGLPDELLQIPALQALMAGTPPALSATLKEFQTNPAAQLIVKNKDDLMRAGLGFYRSLSGQVGVIFNQFHLHPQDLQAADKAGKLGTLAPSFDSVNHEVSKSGPQNPVLASGNVPGGPKPPTVKGPPQTASGMLAPANEAGPTPSPAAAPMPSPGAGKIQQKIMGARLANVNPGSPTSGPVPGQGRILNNILKPVV